MSSCEICGLHLTLTKKVQQQEQVGTHGMSCLCLSGNDAHTTVLSYLMPIFYVCMFVCVCFVSLPPPCTDLNRVRSAQAQRQSRSAPRREHEQLPVEAEGVIGLLSGSLLLVPKSHTNTYLHRIQLRGRDCSPARAARTAGAEAMTAAAGAGAATAAVRAAEQQEQQRQQCEQVRWQQQRHRPGTVNLLRSCRGGTTSIWRS